MENKKLEKDLEKISKLFDKQEFILNELNQEKEKLLNDLKRKKDELKFVKSKEKIISKKLLNKTKLELGGMILTEFKKGTSLTQLTYKLKAILESKSI